MNDGFQDVRKNFKSFREDQLKKWIEENYTSEGIEFSSMETKTCLWFNNT